MEKAKKYIFPAVAVVCVLMGFMVGEAVSNKVNAQRFYIQNGQLMVAPSSKIEQTLQLLERAYVDSLDVDSLTDVALTELIEQLDPHSSYIPKKDIELVNSELAGSFSGIGVQFTIQNDTVNIVDVISGGPSEHVGVMPGDKIVEVNDSSFTGKGMTNERVMHTLRGPKGTEVTLGIRRSGTSELLRFNIVRGDIPVHSVDAHFIVESPKSKVESGKAGRKIGFVRVNKFGETTYSEFISALAELRAEGAEQFIVDLRSNGGGFMMSAERMANEFLDYGDMIVYAKGRAYPLDESRANGLGRFKDVPLVVLIDNFSASASEIFAGAMQDNDRATIIGQRSFGKGLVQQQIPYADGSALRLTVARYYTPSGRCIQKPYTMGDNEAYAKDLMERYDNGEFFSADSIHYKDTTVYKTKNGRSVYGGGGIMPDIFVARDTSANCPFYNIVWNRGYTYQFAYSYADRHRKELSRYTDWRKLEQHLLAANWLPEFVRFAEGKDVKPKEGELDKCRKELIRIVNAYIVRDILGDKGFYPLYERDDETTKRAVEELSK